MPVAANDVTDDRTEVGPAAEAGPAGEGAEATVVARAAAGSEEAWETLYVQAYPKLLAYARRRLPTVEHAHDAVAETMTRAVAAIGTWSGEGGGFHAWLYGILRHVVTDTQRTVRRERPARNADLPRGGGEPLDHTQPHEPLLQTEDAVRLRAAYAGLNVDEQEILELRVVAGLPAEQVAHVLGRRPGAIRMAQSRALARLRRLLADQDRHRDRNHDVHPDLSSDAHADSGYDADLDRVPVHPVTCREDP